MMSAELLNAFRPAKGMVFAEESVRGLMAGTKSQTRRVAKLDSLWVRLPREVKSDLQGLGLGDVNAPAGKYRTRIYEAGAVAIVLPPKLLPKNRPGFSGMLGVKPGEFEWIPPAGCVGDRVWVRETWALLVDGGTPRVVHRADDAHNDLLKDHGASKWSNARYMPRWACRLELTLWDAKLQRLHDITEEDAIAEGVRLSESPGATRHAHSHRDAYSRLWDVLNYERAPWASNPWVWKYVLAEPTPVTPRSP